MHCSIHPVGISTEDSGGGGGEVQQPHHRSRIPFVKANGFCYPDYPMNQEELKWELRSQIHPASNPVQTENSSTVNLLNERASDWHWHYFYLHSIIYRF